MSTVRILIWTDIASTSTNSKASHKQRLLLLGMRATQQPAIKEILSKKNGALYQ
jgi:hypothetical protein